MQHAVDLWNCLLKDMMQKRCNWLENRLNKYLDNSSSQSLKRGGP